MAGSRGGFADRYIVADIPMRLTSAPDDGVQVSAKLRYSTRDPYAVHATFTRAKHTPVVWVFARELLLAGVAQHAGAGDVQVRPSGDDVIIDLMSPEGSAQLAANSDDVRGFCARMLELVAAGDEPDFVDVDAELAALDPAMFATGEA